MSEPSTTLNPSLRSEPPSNRFYRTVWRWHFYAGRWLRRPKQARTIGAPALPPYVQHWQVPMAIVAVLGIAFPLVGVSLVTVLLLDYFVLSRIPTLKRVFS